MECNKDEALRAKTLAEEKMMKNDFEGARKIALKAKKLFSELNNISQLIAVCDIHCSAQNKINGAEKDLYGILQVQSIADEGTIRKQYRKLALVLHPDKNKFSGAEAAFKLIGEANMILSDKGKRAVYDVKCRDPARACVTKLQNCQGNQNSYAGQNKFKHVPSSQFNGLNHAQQSTSNPSVRFSFWTYCPLCNIKYEYYRDFVNKPLRCQHCSKLFIAYDIGAQGAAGGPVFVNEKMQSVNIGSNRAQSVSQQKEGGKREKVKVNIQKDTSHFAHKKIEEKEVGGSSRTGMKQEEVTKPKVNNIHKPVETGTSKETNKKRGRKMVVESSESSSDGKEAAVGSVNGGDSVDRRRSSRQKQNVSYREDGGNECSPLKRSKLKKEQVSGCEDKSCKTNDIDKEVCEEKSHANANVSMPNGATHNDHSNSDSDPELVDCLDSEFTNFDKDKEYHCFAVDQIWACYDSVDSMPRFYAQIRNIYKTEFQLQITWLEPDPENEPEIKWAEEGLPVACGKFVHGETEQTKDLLMFSHQIVYKKGGGRFPYVIFPQKGEIWALFKDWDIKWSLDPEKHKKYKFDIVEILSVDDNGVVSVAFLLKVKGFVSVFQRTIWAGLVEHKIMSNEQLRFSHRIKSVKLSGTERAGVPAGSFELDTASLPDDLEEYYYTKNVNIEPGNSTGQKVKPVTPKRHKNSGLDNEMLKLRRSPRGSKGGDPLNGVKEKVNDGQSPEISSASKKLGVFSHDFSSDKQMWKFQVGQIWAFWKNHNEIIQCYAQIKQIEFNPLRLYISLLKPFIPSNYTIQNNACGLFKVTCGKPKILSLDSFSHIVKAEDKGNNIYNIYPREQQIWALYTSADVTVGECDIVEVLESDGSGIKVQSLSHVPSYNSVFKVPRIQRSTGRIVVIPREELKRFSRQIPAFLFTEDKDGSLRGRWELDPAALKGLPLIGANEVSQTNSS